MLKINNVLLGHSSNSSSTHSIILFKGDELPNEYWDKEYFGWDFFTVTTKESKLLYLESCLYQTFTCNFKNYDEEIKLFIDWIMPNVKVSNLEFLGYWRTEDSEDPVIIRKRE